VNTCMAQMGTDRKVKREARGITCMARIGAERKVEKEAQGVTRTRPKALREAYDTRRIECDFKKRKSLGTIPGNRRLIASNLRRRSEEAAISRD
jgi:hypothetical protein